MNNFEIKLAQICCFKNLNGGSFSAYQSSGNKISVIKMELDEKTINEITCIIDEENDNAIDIFTGDVYRILKRGKDGRIIDDISSLETNHYYVLHVLEDKKVTESQLYRIYCNDLANKVFAKYKKSLASQGKQVKVKKLDKKNK